MGSLLVEAVHEGVEARLLLQDIGRRGMRRFGLQCEM